ncbi:hypothetical protein CAEBREN_11445 [Caenorhabditis brenneri]|uniref:F-box domain-containing protein n=1 Tax=Caenorhabditis brenneri TaxID=135651 RepID=G0PI00_CAEBE|nr:hypothetical protein CAEBREN_11445 [Caenorhabditis brenneri]
MTLPLFKLPILVIKLVLETMGFIDLFVLTSASSKTKRIVKNLITIRNFRMNIFIKKEAIVFCFQKIGNLNYLNMIYMEPEKKRRDDVFRLKIGTNNVPSTFDETVDNAIVLTIYWKQTIDHVTKLYNTFFEIFKTPLKGINIDLKDVAVETYRSWIKWNNDYFFDSLYLEIVGTSTFHDYVWILKNVRTKNMLFLNAEPTDYPEDPENNEIVNVEAASVYIWFGRWMSMQQLKAIKAESITVRRVSSTDSQINTFLREMKALEVPSYLKKLRVRFNREANPAVVLEGLDVINEDLERPDDVLNQWSFTMASGEKCTAIYVEYEGDVPEFGFEFQVGN